MDGVNNVALGREGSGLAQVVDSSPLVGYANALYQRRMAEQAKRLKQKSDAIDKVNSKLKTFTPHFNDKDQYAEFRREGRQKLFQSVTDESGNIDLNAIDDPTSRFSQALDDQMMAEETYAKASIESEKNIEAAKKLYAEGKLDEEHYLSQLEKLENAKNIGEKLEISRELAREDFDPYAAFDSIDVGTFTDIKEDPSEGGPTIKTVTMKEQALRRALAPIVYGKGGDADYQRGKEKGYWSDREGYMKFAIDYFRPGVNEQRSETYDEGGGGLDFNFGGGGNTMKKGKWTIEKFDLENSPQGQITDPGKIGFSFSYAEKSSPKIELQKKKGPKGESENIEGEITEIVFNPNHPQDGGYIVLSTMERDPNDINNKLVPVTKFIDLTNANKAHIKNITGFDVDDVSRQYLEANPAKKKSTDPVESITDPIKKSKAYSKWGGSIQND